MKRKPVVMLVGQKASLVDEVRWLSTNYVVLTAENANRAISLMDSESVALVMTDYNLPGIFGDELLEQVRRKSPRTHRMLVSTEEIDPAYIDELLENVTIEAYLPRPWDPLHLRALVGDLMARHSSTERKYRRLSSRIPVIAWVGRERKGNKLVTANVSRGGAFCESEQRPQVGSAVRLTLLAPFGRVSINGKVAHVVSTERSKTAQTNSGFGVEFTSVSERLQQQIDRLLRSRRTKRTTTALEPVKEEADPQE